MAGYVILNNRVDDPEKMQEYLAAVYPTMQAHGAEVLILDDNAEVVEGTAPFPRVIMLKFESRDAARTWYSSPEYQAALPLRLAATQGFAVLCESFVYPES